MRTQYAVVYEEEVGHPQTTITTLGNTHTRYADAVKELRKHRRGSYYARAIGIKDLKTGCVDDPDAPREYLGD